MTQARDIADGKFDTDTLVVDSTNNRVGVGGSDTQVFTGVGGGMKLVVIGDDSATTVANNSDAGIAIVNTNQTAGNLAGLHFARADTDDSPNYAGASIVARFPDAQVTGQYPKGDLAFLTSTTANAAPSEKMRISSVGHFWVGEAVGTELGGVGSEAVTGVFHYNQSGGSNGYTVIQSDGNNAPLYVAQTVNCATSTLINFGDSGSTVGSISTNGTTTAYNTSSDYRLKENVTPTWDATTRLKQLNPVRFNFIADADTTVDGFLAHEVQSVVPEAITGTHNEVDDDGNPVYQGIDQSKLVPLLVKTIQELEARIVALENA